MSVPRTKDDIDLRRDGPAVNVKVTKGYDRFPMPLEFGQVKEAGETEFHDVLSAPEFTHEWIEANLTDEDLNVWWGSAAESGWEMLDEEAKTIFGPSVKVYSDGRSDGWAVVHGLSDVEGWDAVALGKWRRFCKVARLIADDHPYQMLSLIYLNVYEPGVEAAKSEGVAAT